LVRGKIVEMIDPHVIDQIKNHAIAMDWSVAFGGRAKGNQHLFRVVTIATFLAEKEQANRTICEAGAWLHDIGLIAGNDDNPGKVRTIAEEFLTRLPLNDEDVSKIAECVETHEGRKYAGSLEAQIVHDADVLDKMGLLGVIRHTWKIVNLIQPDATAQRVFSILQKHLAERREKIYSATARSIASVLNESLYQFFKEKTKAMETITMIMQLARESAISDEIARKLLLKMDNQSLPLQLTISHEILQDWYEKASQEGVHRETHMPVLL